MSGSPSQTSHSSKRFRFSIFSSALTSTSAELLTSSFSSMSKFLLNTCRAKRSIGCSITSVTRDGCTQHATNLLWLEKHIQVLATVKVPTEAFTTRFPDLVYFSAMLFIHTVFFKSKPINSLNQDSLSSSFTRALLAEASECCRSDLTTQEVFSSPLQVRQTGLYQLHPRTMTPSTRIEGLVPQRLYGLAS